MLPGKIEGITVVGSRTIALANDNDFGLGDFDANGKLNDTGVPNRLVVVRLPKPLGTRGSRGSRDGGPGADSPGPPLLRGEFIGNS
jgi:hypothetical protein